MAESFTYSLGPSLLDGFNNLYVDDTKSNQTKDVLENSVTMAAISQSSATCSQASKRNEASFNETFQVAKETLIAGKTSSSTKVDDLVRKVTYFNNPVLDKPKRNVLAKNSSPLGSIARNRPVRSCSMKSQKIIADYFRK